MHSAVAPSPAHSKKPVEPKFPSLSKLPETPEDLFRSLALTVSCAIDQPDPAGKKSPRRQEYTLPWVGFESWHDARVRLNHFEKNFKGKIEWAPFNDSSSNDGPMSLNAYPGRAFIERVTNEGDANLEAKAITHTGPMPASPFEAATQWFGLGPSALSTGFKDDAARTLAQKTVTVTGFVGDAK